MELKANEATDSFFVIGSDIQIKPIAFVNTLHNIRADLNESLLKSEVGEPLPVYEKEALQEMFDVVDSFIEGIVFSGYLNKKYVFERAVGPTQIGPPRIKFFIK
ncbi:hypothetical protein NKH48_13665 [Mesorhizobium sp. M1233]|uniref:hypothetical protein n=1 Tax=Mesorhizobium sp. M1233 TaxID=2957072 RepID=UPI00333DBE48